jgi:hypothetical protein
VRDAAANGTQEASPYYPPRARWYTTFWYPWYLLKRRLHLHVITDSSNVPLHKLLLGAAIPGLAWLWYGRYIFSLMTGMAYVLSLLTLFIWIGYPTAGWALSILMSIHTSSIMYMLRRMFPERGLWQQIGWSLIVFILLGLLVYGPAYHYLQRRWFIPMRIGERVLVVNTASEAGQVKRGDWVAYRIHSQQFAQVRVNNGYELGQVLAVAGDKVLFSPDGFSVQGERRPLLGGMPTGGDMVVAERCWFIWPNVAITGGHGTVGADLMRSAMSQLAIVSESDFVGVPYRRWWWRQQTLP